MIRSTINRDWTRRPLAKARSIALRKSRILKKEAR